jgi:hypothetical protein
MLGVMMAGWMNSWTSLSSKTDSHPDGGPPVLLSHPLLYTQFDP